MNYELKELKSYSATAENSDALSGGGGKENNGRKGCPCIEPLAAGTTKVLLHKYGSGTIRKYGVRFRRSIQSICEILFCECFGMDRKIPV